tara:strand:- start:1261 stop:2793 length:1533 start_codon:yes stop_codon:yes gene_type:complete
MTDAFRDALKQYAYRYHIHHPFDKLLQSGRASKEMLQMWAANRYYYQDTIPRKDAAIIAKCPDSQVRGTWCKHIQTHDVDNALGEWLYLTRALGLVDIDVIQGRYLLPATRFACDAYFNFCRDASWQDGICSSMTHLFAGDIHTMRIQGWPEKYPWLPSSAFTYFHNRVRTLPGEIDSTLQLLSDHFMATPERMQRAVDVLKFKQDVLWSMMDTLWHYFYAEHARMPVCPVPTDSQRSPVVRVLGSGAGGGVPQWNRNDEGNDRARHGCLPIRSQCSIALSSNRTDWVLANCSPDFGAQWNELVRKYPSARLYGIVLTDNQLDHVTGLLSVRETVTPLTIYCTQNVEATLRSSANFLNVLGTYVSVNIQHITPGVPFVVAGLSVTPMILDNRTSKYASLDTEVLALNIEKSVIYAPCVSPAALTPKLASLLKDIPKATVLFDGTFEHDAEMPTVNGHASMEHTLEFFKEHGIRPPTFTHINNTNCSNDDAVALAHDGMEIVVHPEDKRPH